MQSPIRFLLGQFWHILGVILAIIPGSSFVGSLWGKLGAKLRRKPTSHQTTYEWVLSFFVGGVIVLLLLAFLSGCAGNPKGQANAIRDGIHAETKNIVDSVESATGHVESADKKVQAATTQPGNTPETTELLTGAHTDLTNAKGDLAKVAPSAKVIDEKADAAAKITEKVVDENEKIKSGWGYKLQRFVHYTFWTFVFAAPVLAIGVFIVKTNGGGPILSALGEVLGNVISAVWAVIKFVVKWVWKAIFHLSTLGAAKLADITNKHYDQQQAAQGTPPTNSEPK